MGGRRCAHLGVTLLVAVVIVLGQAPTAAADPSIAKVSAQTVARIHAYLDGEVARRHLPGAEFSLVQGTSVVDLSAFGKADAAGRKLTPQTPVLLASLTKNLTATAIMQLVEAGHVGLDQPVTTYLPWFRTADPTASAKITVAELLHHTSGLPVDTPSEFGALDDGSPAALERGIRRLDRVDLVSAPGTTFLYSNTNYNTLGLIVQTVSGEPFADYLARHIFVPAEMVGASVGPQPAGTNAAQGFYPWYGGSFRPTRVPKPGSMTPSAITYASAADLAQVLIMNLNQGRVGNHQILSASAMAQLQRPAVAEDDFTAYAMGWHVRPGWEFDAPTSLTPSSRLPLLLEHDGSWSNTRTFLAFLPQDRIGFALLINANQPGKESELDSLYAGVWRIIAGQEPRDSAATEDLLQQHGWQAAAAVVLLLIVSLVWSLRLIRRPRSAQRPRRRARLLILAAMLIVELAVLAVIWLYLPQTYDAPTVAIARANPDLGLLLGVATVLALGWGPVRTILGLVASLRRRTSTAPR